VKMEHHPMDTEQDYQQERLVSDDYLVGFVEGEGCFYIGVVKSRETSSKWQVVYFFKVSQNPTGRLVLEQLKNRLACGYIKANTKSDKTDKSLAYVVRDLPNIVFKVIPFFKGKLLTKKAEDFEKFCKVVELVYLKQHLNKKGMAQILDIAYTMNTAKRSYTKQEILANF
jgi:hypothetical protein